MFRRYLSCFFSLLLFSCNSTHRDETNTYGKAYNLDHTKRSNKEDLIERLNQAVSNLYLNNPQFDQIKLGDKVIQCEYSDVLDIKKVTSCWKRMDSLFEQIEIVYQKGEVLYMRSDLFEGSSCTELDFIRNVEKSFFELGKNRFTDKANDIYSFSYEAVDKLNLIDSIKAKLY